MTTVVKWLKKKIITRLSYFLLPDRRLFQCNKIYLGNDYGGWTICPDGLSELSIIYSFGVGEDASFDLALITRFGVNVHAFDPTPRSIEWVKKQTWPPGFQFHPFGIGSTDRIAAIYPPENSDWVSHTIIPSSMQVASPIQVQLLCLKSITEMLEHQEIDIIKMDIEGAEYEVIDNLIEDPIINVRQILIEFHHWLYPGVSINMTRNAIHKLLIAGFKLFNISERGIELSFIRL